MVRRDKENYYLDIAQAVAGRGTSRFCAISAPSSSKMTRSCPPATPARPQKLQRPRFLPARKMNIPRGELELCRSVHAEANAIISAARSEMIGSTLYLVGK